LKDGLIGALGIVGNELVKNMLIKPMNIGAPWDTAIKIGLPAIVAIKGPQGIRYPAKVALAVEVANLLKGNIPFISGTMISSGTGKLPGASGFGGARTFNRGRFGEFGDQDEQSYLVPGLGPSIAGYLGDDTGSAIPPPLN